MADMAVLRQSSWQSAAVLGFPKNNNLPLLENVKVCRSKDAVVNRVFAMLCVAASAYGFDRTKTLAWLRREGDTDLLTQAELDFLNGAQFSARFMQQIEGMWALCWCLKIAPDLDFSRPCSETFVKLLPDLKKNEPGTVFRGRASLRDSDEVVANCDLAYCLHWGMINLRNASQINHKIEAYLVVERRRALEWVLSNDLWDEVSLDT